MHRLLVLFVVTLVLSVLTITRPSEAEDLPEFTITVDRDEPLGESLPSRILVNGTDIGAGLERVATKIPAGEYTGIMRYVSGKGHVQGAFGSMANTGDFLLEATGEPIEKKRTNILLHGGTKPEHSDGCILLGAVQKDKEKKEVRWLPDDTTLRKLRLAFYKSDVPNATPAVRIKIIVKDAAARQPAQSGCNWNESVNCIGVKPQSGKRCGKASSFEIDYTNNCGGAVKVVTCVARADQKWSCNPDGTFDDGMKPSKSLNAYVCEGPGSYKVFAMPIDKFKAGHCRYPSGADMNAASK